MKRPLDQNVKLRRIVSKVAVALDADVLLYSGGIYGPADYEVIESIRKKKSRPNVFMILTTLGGSPDAAYRIARCLKHRYSGKFILFVNTECKSAGTLIAMGADEIIMSDEAELGPLDVQVMNRDEVGELSSGLTPIQALTTLRTETFKVFEDQFAKLRYRHFQFPTKMSADIAARMAIGLFKPIYEQLDPMRLGENQRAMMIASDYGARLASGNVKDGSIARLITGYPSHGFVIDREEAKTLFNHVRTPSADEHSLAARVAHMMVEGQENDRRGRPAKVEFLSVAEPVSETDTEIGDQTDDQIDGTDRAGAETGRAPSGSANGDGGTEFGGQPPDASVSAAPVASKGKASVQSRTTSSGEVNGGEFE